MFLIFMVYFIHRYELTSHFPQKHDTKKKQEPASSVCYHTEASVIHY